MRKPCSKTIFKKQLIIVLYCILFISNLHSSQCSASTPLITDTIKLQLKWRNQFQFAGYYAAVIKGFYAEKGLNVKILPGGPHISPVKNVTEGKANIGVYDPGILSKEYTKNNLVVLATIMQSSGYCIISSKTKNILRPADLVGKHILIEDGQGWGIFKTILLKEGIDISKIKIGPRLKDSEDIYKDSVDAVITFIASQPQRLKAMGYDFNIMRPEEYGVDFYGDILFTTKKFAYRNTETTDAFIEASLKGWKYALSHENEIINYILTLPDVRAYGTSRKNLEYEAKEIKKLIMPNLVEIGHTNLGRWQYMLTILQRLGIADNNYSLKGLIYESNENRLSRFYLPLIYVSTFIIIIIIVIMLINSQLRNRVRLSTAKLLKEIEQRKEAEHLANENKEQIELILNSSNIGLWELEIETKKATFNSRFKAVLGYKDEYNLTLEEFYDKIHPDDLKLAQPLFCTENLNIPTKKMTQLRVENAKGQYIYVLSSSKIILKNQKPFKISGIILSIEELKQKELEVLKVSDELIRRNNELKKFAYITSHNIRGPVVNILSLSQMIDQSFLDKENIIIFDKIDLSIKKLETILDDLVELVAHDKSGNLSLEKIDIAETIQSVIKSIQEQGPNNDLNIDFDLKVNKLMLPKHAFLSIITNLITNSIKFRTYDRKLLIEVQAFDEGDNTVLRFNDNGIGIDLLKHKHKIFNLYQRINHDIEGKGIGLFIVRSHMDTLNGRIEIESTPNIGTTFTLYFPKQHFS
ncbi:ABC transporter substrate-binding protein [Pedobacter arcticus]|uniref:ABC transporter substrate-binding protein n=1 Tax=Pedobacter arcticus TaxID=752140 RepID=UPI00030B3FD0|nr:ABC transporter substrate-binding protein [Pedobacter arcticus]